MKGTIAHIRKGQKACEGRHWKKQCVRVSDCEELGGGALAELASFTDQQTSFEPDLVQMESVCPTTISAL